MNLAVVTLEDRRAVYALLDRYLDWLPPARLAVRRPEAGTAKPGVGRWARCETCAGTGRITGTGRPVPCRKQHVWERDKRTPAWPFDHGCRPCPSGCQQGYVRLHGKQAETGVDPMLRQVRDEQVTAAHERAEKRRYIDAQLVKLAALQRQHSGSEDAPDELGRAHEAKERQWRTGSYPALELTLDLLALTAPLRMEALRIYAIEQHFTANPQVRDRLDEIVDWLAARMPRPILLPADAAAELAVWKHTLEHGRTSAHAGQRRERNEQILQLVETEGWSLRRVGRVFDLSHERVRGIVNELGLAATVVASGPAA